jgi:hypothetical protein
MKEEEEKTWTLKWILRKVFWLYITYYAAKTAYRCNKHESKFIMVPVVLLALFYSPYYLGYYFIYHFILRVPCAMSLGNSTVLVG